MADGFSHVGLSTHDMEATIRFYENVLGCRRVSEERIRIIEGGSLRHVFFEVGEGQFVAFIEPHDAPGFAAGYDTGINRGLGVPNAVYHLAFRVSSVDQLEERRKQLVENGVAVSPIVDLGAGKSIFFHDPNGVQLEYCCQMRAFVESDLHGEVEASAAMLG